MGCNSSIIPICKMIVMCDKCQEVGNVQRLELNVQSMENMVTKDRNRQKVKGV